MKNRIWGILLSVSLVSSLWMPKAYAEEIIPGSDETYEEPMDPEEFTTPEGSWDEPFIDEAETEEVRMEEKTPDPVSDQTVSVQEEQSSRPEQVPEGFSEENGLMIFSEENADLLYTEDPEDQELIEEIQDGEMIALAAVTQEAGTASSVSAPGIARAAASASPYRLVVGETLNPDEVTKQMSYREIVYRDENGVRRTAPIYCLNASKEGFSTQTLKAEAVRALKNSTIQKLLYFGYGGPGDISDSYDPTCEHIRWSKWQNRYVFTHMALSKVYSKEYGRSNEKEYEHAGVNRYLAKIKSLKIPARDGIVFQTKDRAGNLTAEKDQTVYFSFFRKKSMDDHTWDWADFSDEEVTDGFMVSNVIQMVDTGKANNTITISRESDDDWQLGFWESEEEYSSRGEEAPRVLGKGESVVIKSGYVFRIILPLSYTREETWTFPMSLNPVTFLFVDGSVQTGKDVQDFGTYVYQGTPASASLRLVPDMPGALVLTKKDVKTEGEVSGATYGLFAAEEIWSGDRKLFSENESVAEGVTDENGRITFSNIPAGKYLIKEISASPGYLLDAESHETEIGTGENSIVVTEIPKLQGGVSIRKTDQATGEDLKGAVFTIYTWDRSVQAYTGGKPLAYDAAAKRYVSDTLYYSPDNQGRFQIKESVNPEGYIGSFTQELTLEDLNPGETKLFEYRVENVKITYPHVEILKIDAESGKNLPGAEFTIYEWKDSEQKYQPEGSLLSYDSENEKYLSGDLKENEENKGKFKIVETKNPDGYEGSWEQEVTVHEKESVITYTVPNSRISPPKGKLQITKKDSLTKKELSDAEFRIYPWSKSKNAFQKSKETSLSMTWLEEEKIYESEELVLTADNQGKFLAVETKNPMGYEGAWSQEILFTEDGQILSLEVENSPLMGQITIIKKIKAEDIIWAHGIPTFFFTITGEDQYGLHHTYEASISFVRDVFSVDGNGLGVMQVTIPKIPLGEYRIYEKPVLRYFLKDAQANTGNVLITHGGASCYGSDPKQAAYGTARLSSDARNASITFINEKSRYDGYSHNSSVKNTIPIKFE